MVKSEEEEENEADKLKCARSALSRGVFPFSSDLSAHAPNSVNLTFLVWLPWSRVFITFSAPRVIRFPSTYREV